jgi:hypothetical protein
MTMKPGELAAALWQQLWQEYRQRVPYAQVYEHMIQQAGGKVVNDHIAFRSLRLQIDCPHGPIDLGISYLAPLVEALGYRPAGAYPFPEQHLYARHYHHPEQATLGLPKLFISELLVDELPDPAPRLMRQTVHSICENPTALDIPLHEASEPQSVLEQFQNRFRRPWSPPWQTVVETVNAVSQYGAWVLLHGYGVNHFTGYVNGQTTPQYPDIEATAQGLAARGVPMKAAIEGSRGSGLRQTATQAATELVTVRDEHSGTLIQIPWTYAYYEIAERGWVEVAPGQREWFEGFLGPQASHLFEMTRRRKEEFE